MNMEPKNFENQEIPVHEVSAIIEDEVPKIKEKKAVVWFLHSLQRGFLVAGAVFLAYIFVSSVFFIENENGGYETNFLLDDISSSSYEDSRLFNSILSDRISDMITFGVLQSQLETNGRFDSRKVINVTAFSNRQKSVPDKYITAHYYLGDLINWAQNGFVYSYRNLSLRDLESFFAQENIVYSTNPVLNDDEHDIAVEIVNDVVSVYLEHFETQAKISRYFSDSDIVIDVNEYAEYGLYILDIYYDEEYGDTMAIMRHDDFDIISINNLMLEFERLKQIEEDRINNLRPYYILDNLYQTIEEKYIEDYVADYTNYRQLCLNVEKAANDLRYNFNQYDHYRNIVQNSNIYYIILTTTERDRSIYSNFDFNVDLSDPGNVINNIDALFNRVKRPSDKYIKLNLNNIEYETNTNINDDFIRNELQKFSYVYPPNTQVWIGVNSSYPIKDTFYQGYHGYESFFSYYINYLIAAGICFLAFLILLIILTKYTGRRVRADGTIYTKLRNFDRIYTEIWIVLSFALPIILLYITFKYISYNLPFYWLAYISETIVLLMIGGYVYIISLLISLFYYSIVRRIKAKSLWKDSLIKRLIKYCKKIGKSLSKLMLLAYDNSKLSIRFLTPIAGIVFLHIIMLFFISNVYYKPFKFTLSFCIIVIDLAIGAILFISAKARETIVVGINKISSGDLKHKVDEKQFHGDNLILARAVNNIGDSISTAVEISLRDERMKADLITNVSHDIKTPLTSIINYIDLIKREDIIDETIKNYINILDSKSQRLKQLTDDLVEASKISSGNIEYKMEKINLTELVNQTIGEFEEKFAQRSLQINLKSLHDNMEIEADSRRIWRVMENLFNNIYKYAMANTRVYIELITKDSGQVELSIKNISEQPLNFNADELTERFIRGDVSRSTEGSGLGLSIAKSLTEAQNGRFEIKMDGDLFKVMLTFPLLEKD